MNFRTAAFILILIFIISPVTADLSGAPAITTNNQPAVITPDYTIQLFAPTASMIHSDQIKDQINGLDGVDVLFATSFGLSVYDGTWKTRHANRENISAGLLDDYVTAIEYDEDGNLWLGYSGGIQIYNSREYQTIRDQQILKDPRINDLQRWNDDMWVATGNAGIHRVHEGTWTWYQPMTPSGPGFFDVDSMAVDPAANALAIATKNDGLWIIRSPEEPIRFEQIAGEKTSFGSLDHVRRDPLGGVYFFDKATIVHYGADGFTSVVTSRDLSPVNTVINDISAGPDGKLYIASDDGLYIWYQGKIYRHLTRFEWIGASSAVRTVNVDTWNRVWFSTQGYVGYYIDTTEPEKFINIYLVTPEPVAPAQTILPEEIAQSGVPITTLSGSPGLAKTGTSDGNSSVFDPVTNVINSITGIFGIRFFP